MIHKIEPHKYYPGFRNQEPRPMDYLLIMSCLTAGLLILHRSQQLNPETWT